MSIEDGDLAQRILHRALMRREILFFALLHDIRGSLTSLMGWHSMMDEDGQVPWAGMGRSIEGLRLSTVEFSNSVSPTGGRDFVDLGARLQNFRADWDVVGEGRVDIDIIRLLSALELAEPSRIEVSNSNGLVLLQIKGLGRRGVVCLESQTSKELLALAEIEGRDWGVVLLKETVRGVRGSTISVTDATTVTIELSSEEIQ
jgi:hypothetical protein